MEYGKSLKATIISATAILGACTATHAQEIKFWTLSFDNPNAAKTFEDFEAANPGVTVKLENRGTDERKSALRVTGAADQAPDIRVGSLGLGGEFVKSGLAPPMDKYYTHHKWDGSLSLKV